MKSRNDISNLLDKYIQSETTLEEERTLREYFISEHDIPEEWRAYSILFNGFAGKSPCMSYKRRRLPHLWIATAAASIILAFLLFATYRDDVATTPYQPMVQTPNNNTISNIPTRQQHASNVVSVAHPTTSNVKSVSKSLPRKDTDAAKQKTAYIKHAMRLLDEADMAFTSVTQQCEMDINEISSHDGEWDDIDSETIIII